MASSTAGDIVDTVGGPDNIVSLTHCATRLRFQLRDSSGIDQTAVEAIPGVLGAVPQGGNRYQIVMGGAVTNTYQDIMGLPEMSSVSSGAASDADDMAATKAAARAQGPRGKVAWLDNFFEFLSDSFRPIIGALLGASLFITFMSLMSTLGVIPNWADPRVTLPPTWAYLNLFWQGVFVFLPLMVAYNASKKLNADPWVGFAIMAVVMLPGFTALKDISTPMTVFGSTVNVVPVFGGIPLTIFSYNSQVFPPLLMAGVLGPLYKLLRKIIPENVQLIFVPFLAMLIMIPLTSLLIGPLGIYAGAALAGLLGAINSFSPLIFAIAIPLLYPFMVPLGLHWPINAIMLLNIQNLGYDYIQGPMGAWNFACFGATAGVLFLANRDKETAMRQTATGALAAGLLGGISEPSLYGIHLRYKRIYPRMLVGCLLGGLIIGIGGGLRTNAFVFTSLLTIPAFNNIPLYAIAVAVAFFSAMILVIISDYRTPEQKAEALALKREHEADAALEAGKTDRVLVDPNDPQAALTNPTAGTAAAGTAAAGASAATAVADRPAEASAAPAAPAAKPKKPAMVPGTVTEIGAPLDGKVIPLEEIPDPVFAKGTVGPGVGIVPSGNVVHAPAPGKILVAQETGHAFGLTLDSGIELLIHVGIDTVTMEGRGFDVHVKRGDTVEAGTPLVTFDPKAIEDAGFSLVTPVLVTNAKRFGSVEKIADGDVATGTPVIAVTAKEPKTD
ncbi:glucose PTS transporter subunit IIA [Nigerium massiliense]|uniref:glucose PTS transporter subunit IIA n=1 Tax=Nigerium massiliense TaxID=1522317 RepID=UPI00058CD94B|nr:glucose PTS transporter subunit IIA [Nigerium massiliense]